MNETAWDEMQKHQERLSDSYPAYETAGFRLHVFHDGGWHVWLNTEASDFDGLCLVCDAATREEAIEKGRELLQTFRELLRAVK